MSDSGEVLILLNAGGQLRDLTAIPPQVLDGGVQTAAVEWSALFRAGGLDYAAWKPADPRWAPRFYGDGRYAWSGPTGGPPVRVEAASFAGRAVNFFVILPWTRPSRVTPPPVTRSETVSNIIGAFVLALLMAGGAIFARRNLRLGRGDRRGATRLAAFTLALMITSWVVGEDHAAQFWEIYLFVTWTGFALFAAAMLWVLYIAGEPYIRRNSPGLLVSWSRLLAGRFNDPLVGRDLLIGCAISTAAALDCVQVLLPGWFGRAAEPLLQAPAVFDAPHLLLVVTMAAVGALFIGLAAFFLLFVARLALRRVPLAVGAVTLIFAAPSVLTAVNPLLVLPVALALNGLLVVVLARVGLLAAVVAIFYSMIAMAAPSVLPLTGWQAGLGVTMLGSAAALVLYGFYRSLGGRSPFGALALDA